jgi:hypothetical protein
MLSRFRRCGQSTASSVCFGLRDCLRGNHTKPSMSVAFCTRETAGNSRNCCKSSGVTTSLASVYTVEFQKRDLPHAHIFHFLNSEDPSMWRGTTLTLLPRPRLRRKNLALRSRLGRLPMDSLRWDFLLSFLSRFFICSIILIS